MLNQLTLSNLPAADRPAKLQVDLTALRARAALGRLVADIITVCSHTDMALARTVAFSADSNPEVVAAMWSRVGATRAQDNILDAAMQISLSPKEYDLFKCVHGFAKTVRDRRHQLAHWLWATSPDRPDNAYLVEPTVFVKVGAQTQQAIKRYRQLLDRGQIPETLEWPSTDLPPGRVLVYDEASLSGDLMEFVTVHGIVLRLDASLRLRGTPAGDEARLETWQMLRQVSPPLPCAAETSLEPPDAAPPPQ